jgi:hypothetical protein
MSARAIGKVRWGDGLVATLTADGWDVPRDPALAAALDALHPIDPSPALGEPGLAALRDAARTLGGTAEPGVPADPPVAGRIY